MTELEKLATKLKDNQESIRIARVPIKTKRAFIELANEEFCGDYGMCLKWLIDGLLDKDTQIILAELDEIKSKLFALESKPEEKKRVIKKLDGSRIEVEEKKNEHTK